MKILLLGKDGQVGWELQRSLAPLGSVTALGRADADFHNPERLRAVLSDSDADVIVNAAAYTKVDKAEADHERARRINAEAVAILAAAARARNALLVHYSTDYVYDGRKSGAYLESDATHPLSVYGRTKLAGDEAIAASGCRHFIFRTSWVYAARGANFLRTILRLAAEREELRIVADQFGAPTSAELIADVTALAIYRAKSDRVGSEPASGVYHLVADGETTWHGFAREIVVGATALGIPLRTAENRIVPIAAEDYPLPAVRPMNSRLSTQRLTDAFGIALPDWRMHLRRALIEISENR